MTGSTMRLSELCDFVGLQVDPASRAADDVYVGLEHVASGRFSRIGEGKSSEVNSSKYVFQSGDVLYGKLRPYLDKAVVATDTGICTTELLVLRPKEGVDPRFLVGVVHAPSFVEHAVAGTTGVQHPRTSWNHIRDFDLPKFRPDEQTKIAGILWEVHDAIIANERAIAAGGELKRAAMRELFTKGLRGEAQKDTELGPVPESWKFCQIGQYFQIKHGFAFSGDFFRPSGKYVLLTPGHFSEDGGFRAQGDKTKYFIGEFDSQYLLNPGDLLVAMTEQKPGLLGSAAFIPEQGQYLHNQRLGLIVDLDKEGLLDRYLYHLLNVDRIRTEISRTSTGSKVKHTSPSRIRAVLGPIPPLDEQHEIVAILDSIDAKIDLHRRKRDVLDELFKALLHKLMTGEIRVANLDLSALQPLPAKEAAA